MRDDGQVVLLCDFKLRRKHIDLFRVGAAIHTQFAQGHWALMSNSGFESAFPARLGHREWMLAVGKINARDLGLLVGFFDPGYEGTA